MSPSVEWKSSEMSTHKAKPRVMVLNTEYARGEAEGNRMRNMHEAKPRVIDCLVGIRVNTEYAQGEAEGNGLFGKVRPLKNNL